MTRLTKLKVTLCLIVLFSASSLAATTNLTWFMYGQPELIPIYETFVREFEERNPDITVELMPLVASGDYMEKLITLFVAGNPPDVFLTFAQHRDLWIERGLLYDLTDLFQASDLVSPEMYYPPVRDVIEVDGKLWGTPWSYNTRLWIINSDLREQRGLTPPDHNWTIDTFQDYARKMTGEQDGVIGTSMGLSLSPGPSHLGWMYNFTGHYWVDEDLTQTYVDHPGSADLLEFWLELRDSYGAAYGYGTPTPPGGTRGGRVGMFEAWATEPLFLDVVGQQSFEWELATYPVGPHAGQHFAQGHLWTIPANHPQPEVAWRFVEFLGSMRAEELWAEMQRTPPQVHDMDLWEMYFANLRPGKRQEAIQFILNDLYGSGRAQSFTYWPVYDEILPIMQDAVNSAMRNELSPQSALANAAQRIRAVLANR